MSKPRPIELAQELAQQLPSKASQRRFLKNTAVHKMTDDEIREDFAYEMASSKKGKA